jgi:hypothetical protein
MPKISRESATHIDDYGPVEDRHDDLNGYTVSFATFAIDIDGAPLLKGLPDDCCHCPHWGYVFKGTTTFTFADRVETYGPGDAFYIPPGHTPAHSEGSEILLFSPADALKETVATMEANMAAMSGGPS